jgi:serine/threonine protein kinase
MQELKTGFTIKDRYVIVSKQGDGTLGTAIYLGHDKQDDKDIIIRILPANMLSDKEMISRFNQGVELTKKLKHPNILEVFDCGNYDNIKYLITSYKKGYFLNDYLEHRGQLDETESIKLIKALSEALNYAWQEERIIHRNISPDTILVAKGNLPLLTDFDLAKSLESDNKLTLEGYTVGNPLYMSPEQALGKDVDFHSDIYCLGLVFYQLLTGAPPFHDKSRMEVLKAQISEKHPPIKSVNKDISDGCESVINKMLEKNEKDRYTSWEDVIKDLSAILKREAPSTLHGERRKSPDSKYKMQAVQMPETTETSAPKENQVVETKKMASPLSNDNPPNSSSKKGRIILLLIAAITVISLLLIVLIKQKSEKVTPSKITIKEQDQTKNIPLAVKSEAITEKKDQKEAAQQVVSDTKKADEYKQACMGNIKQIALALQMYANVFETKYPKPDGAKGLDVLRSKGFLEVPQVFICPATGHSAAAPGTPITEESCDYVYVGGYSEYSDPTTPILWSKPGNHKDFGIILYANGEIKEFTGNNWLYHTEKKKK